MPRKKRYRRPIVKLRREADRLFSLKTRADSILRYGKCPLCTTRGATRRKPIQCCFHFVSRHRKSVRWDQRNVIGACNTCNYVERYFPDLSRAWYVRTFGAEAYVKLVDDAAKDWEPTEDDLREIINKYA